MRKLWMLSLLCAILVLAFSSGGIAVEHGKESIKTALSELKGKTEELRKSGYEGLAYPAGDWFAGLVVSKDPLAIVAEMPATGEAEDVHAKLHVWTGLTARSENDLIAVWDEVWVDKAGKPVHVRTAVEKGIIGYFAADHQRKFRTEAYSGIYPWVWMPTDREAERAKKAKVSDQGTIDFYGNDFGGEPVNLIDHGSATLFPAIPSRIVDRTPFTEQEPTFTAIDTKGHWAYAYMSDLMNKGLLHGYKDQTVRPEGTLSRAEFVSLLLQAIHIEKDGTSSYADTAKHWSSQWVAAAGENGIVPASVGKSGFRPDEPITRIEMADMLKNALAILYLTDAGVSKPFSDTDSLLGEQKKSLQIAAGYGILNGFENGKFGPNQKLKRAQAFVVISKLVELQ